MLSISTDELRKLASLRDELADLVSRSGIELPLRQMARGADPCGGGCKGCEGCKGQQVLI